MYLNNYENHISCIIDHSRFANKFQCEKCNKMFKRQWRLKRHYTNCYERTKYIFPGGFQKNQETIFDKLESLTLYVPETKRYYQTYAVWDIEAVLMKTNRPSTEQLQFLSKHVPVTISVSSNVEGYHQPKYFVDVYLQIILSPR